MTWEPRTMPDVTPETEQFWAGAARGEFLLRGCDECGFVFYYPRAMCPDCLSENVSWREATGLGEVYSYTVSHQVKAWPQDDLPLVHAFVELDEGPRLMTNLVNCDPDDVGIGARVEVLFEPTEDDDIAIPLFTLAERD